MKECPVCNKQMLFAFPAKLLYKYDVSYYHCTECGLLQTEQPYWIEEAYKSAIADQDTGLVARNIRNRYFLEPILYYLFESNAKFVDIAGGYGLLTRLMRDIGFDFYHHDEHCSNVFAKYFSPPSSLKADCLTAFEILEHLKNPIEFIKDNLDKYNCKSLIFSTTIFNGGIPHTDWDYYSFSTGQHITFYQTKTLDYIAQKLHLFHLHLHSDLHIMTSTPLKKSEKLLLANSFPRGISNRFVKWKRRSSSKTLDDHNLVKTINYENIGTDKNIYEAKS